MKSMRLVVTIELFIVSLRLLQPEPYIDILMRHDSIYRFHLLTRWLKARFIYHMNTNNIRNEIYICYFFCSRIESSAKRLMDKDPQKWGSRTCENDFNTELLSQWQTVNKN